MARVPIRGDVSQISPPIRILLVLAVAVMGVYMMFLRPKTEEVPPIESTTTTTTSTPETTETTASSTTKQEPAKAEAAAEPAEDVKGLPKPVQSAIRKDKVLVLLFWNDRAADDRAVHKALGKVDRHDGRVFVKSAPIKEISKYGRIARGVNVEQSPTVVVADRDLRAQTLVGYSDRTTIDQAVTDALVNSTGLYTDTYLKAVDKVCVQHSAAVAAIPSLYVDNRREADTRLARYDRGVTRFLDDFKAVKAPKKYASFHRGAVADVTAYNAAVHKQSVAVTATNTAVTSVVTSTSAALRPLGKKINQRFNGQGLYRCGSQF